MNRLMKMAGFMPVILGTLCACQSASTERYDIANKEDLYKNLPFEMPVRWCIPLSRGWTCSVASRLSLR